MNKIVVFVFISLFISCKNKIESISPEKGQISESIYASGVIKSKNQYQSFVNVNGIINKIFIKEGEMVKKGTPILSIYNETQKYNKDNALLAADLAALSSNQGKLNDAQLSIELAKKSMQSDSTLYYKYKNLWDNNQIGTLADLEHKKLAYENSKNAYSSAQIRFTDLKKTLNFNANQSKKNLQISNKLESDFILKSEVDGMVYRLFKNEGEIISPQTPIAVIGSSNQFILEMQIDEKDIIKVRKNQKVIITMDSYDGKTFEAKITKISPYMNEKSKTFLVEAEFVIQPEVLYPNITFEANIILNIKNNVMLIPRNYLVQDSIVYDKNGEKIIVKTGLKDYRKVEITSGLSENDAITLPKK
jgi:RND family efflux transporter MFP subunit